jgi:hypothetical protein
MLDSLVAAKRIDPFDAILVLSVPPVLHAKVSAAGLHMPVLVSPEKYNDGEPAEPAASITSLLKLSAPLPLVTSR